MRGFTVCLALLLAAPLHAQTWTRAHGGPDQASFNDVATDPIDDRTPVQHIPLQGPFAPGAAVVVADRGTAYVATLDGTLVVVPFNGPLTKFPHPGRFAYTAPLVGADASVYLATSDRFGLPPARDHRTTHAWLDRYDPAGNLQWERALPKHNLTSGAAMALNTVGTGASEAILVAAREPLSNGSAQVNLVGFDRAGNQLFNQNVGGSPPGDVTGGGFTTDEFCIATAIFGTIIWYPPCELQEIPEPPNPDLFLPADYMRGFPIGIAIAANNTIVVSDGYRGIRGYSFTPGSGIIKTFDKIDFRDLTTAPAILPSQRSVYGVAESRIAFSGPSQEHVADILHDPNGDKDQRVSIIATPTRLADGRVLTIGFDGKMTIVTNVVPSPDRLNGEAQTAAAVAASRNVIYVSVRNALLSFDAATGKKLATFALVGGLYPPAIGNDGRVFVLTDTELLIFRANHISPIRRHPIEGDPVRKIPLGPTQ